MERINRDRVLRLWSLVVFKKGRSDYKKDLPKLTMFPGLNTAKRTVGEYLYKENEIQIWWKPHSDFKDLASTILHEYTHYLQFWPWYSRYQKIYSYEKNPYEIEANLSESVAPDYIREISDDNWNYIIKKNPKLRKIYTDSESLVQFNV